MIDLPMFLFFWGAVFIVVTTGVWWLKRERREEREEPVECNSPILSGYMKLFSVFRLGPVQALALAILTSKVHVRNVNIMCMRSLLIEPLATILWNSILWLHVY